MNASECHDTRRAFESQTLLGSSTARKISVRFFGAAFSQQSEEGNLYHHILASLYGKGRSTRVVYSV